MTTIPESTPKIYETSRFYPRATKNKICSCCLRLPIRVVTCLSHAFCSIVKLTVAILQWTYEKAVYKPLEKRIRRLVICLSHAFCSIIKLTVAILQCTYEKVVYKPLERSIRRLVICLSHAFCSIIKFIFPFLQWTYERVVFNSVERKISMMNRYSYHHKEEISGCNSIKYFLHSTNAHMHFNSHRRELKQFFFLLGFMNINMNLKTIDEVLPFNSDKCSEDPSLFQDYETTKKTVEACRVNFSSLNVEYQKGILFFIKIFNCVKTCAALSPTGTLLSSPEDLIFMIIDKELFIDSPEHWILLPKTVRLNFGILNALFQENLPKDR